MELPTNLLPVIVLLIIALFLYGYSKSRNTLIEITKSDQSQQAPQAYLDLNNTYHQALFVGGGEGQPDQLLVKNKDGSIINVIDQTNLSSRSATYDVVTADLDYNGFSDLVVARRNGVTLYKNKGKGRFEIEHLSTNPQGVPLRVNVLDYNKDGHADIYISSQNGPSKLLEGLGGGIMFEDVTNLVGRQALGGVGDLTNAKGHYSVRDVNNDRIVDLVAEDGSGTVYQGTRGASGDKFTSGFQFLKRMGGFFKKGNFKDVVEAGKQNFNWLDLHTKHDGKEPNFVGVKLPDRIPFLNSTVHVVTMNDRTGKLRRQTKQVKGGNDILRFNVNDDNRVVHLSVRTIYENVYEHPYPKINVISNFRDAKW